MGVNKLKIMFELQYSLNNSTNGENWERGVTKNGKRIDWRRSIFMEASELIDSYPWKHWKSIDSKVNRENVKLETVDIWHFIMSEILRINSINGKDIETLSKNVYFSEVFQEYLNSDDEVKFESFYDEIKIIESFIASIICCKDEDIEKLIRDFIEIAKVANLNFNELYNLYIGKNTLNKFRQEQGYKAGNYKKVWNGKEDNEVLQTILNKNSEITPENLYLELKKEYSKLNY